MAAISTATVSSLGDSPGWSALFLSAIGHLVAMALIVVLRQIEPARVVPAKYLNTQTISWPAHLSLNSNQTGAHARAARINRHPRQTPVPNPLSAADDSGQSLRENAKRETKTMTMSLRFHGIYGFYPGHEYQLAVQTSGEIPAISPEQVPPRFEQYVVVEVTIDTEGQVAEARIVAGIVDPTIAHTLLSAIRDFKYTPAKRDGVSIPSQRDIVIHIPT